MAKKTKLKAFAGEKNFVKVCPNCFAEKLNSHLGLTGEGYLCNACGFDNFYPLEVEKKDLKKFRAGLLKKAKGRK